MRLFGDVSVPQHALATVRASTFRQGAGASLTLLGDSALDVQAASARLQGDTMAFPGASLLSSGDVSLEGDMTLLTASLFAPSFMVDDAGRLIGAGTLSTNVSNRGEVTPIEDTLVTGDFTNHDGATLNVQIGTLNILGEFVNEGLVVGDVQSFRDGRATTQPGDGMMIGGDYTAAEDATLYLSSDLWRLSVAGDYDVAIDSNTRYDLALAELRLTGARATDLEVMSTDVGPSPTGLNRTLSGHYPIGTLQLTGNVTTLVDNHDNDALGQSPCEAIYVSHLIINAGATLDTGDCMIYYETLTNNGVVDDPNHLRLITNCPADVNFDGTVDGMDLALLLAAWSTSNPLADLNADGNVDGMDLAALLAAWGTCN
jgi:hypothetical protein